MSEGLNVGISRKIRFSMKNTTDSVAYGRTGRNLVGTGGILSEFSRNGRNGRNFVGTVVICAAPSESGRNGRNLGGTVGI